MSRPPQSIYTLSCQASPIYTLNDSILQADVSIYKGDGDFTTRQLNNITQEATAW